MVSSSKGRASVSSQSATLPPITAARRLTRQRKSEIQTFLEMTIEVETIRNSFPDIDDSVLCQWLVSDVGFSKGRAKALLCFKVTLQKHSDIIAQQLLEISVVESLAATDEQTCDEFFIRLARGEELDADAVDRMVISRQKQTVTPEARRRALMDKAAMALGQRPRLALETCAVAILKIADAFYRNHVRWLEDDVDDEGRYVEAGWGYDPDCSDYALAKAAIVRKSEEASAALETLFGSNHVAPEHVLDLAVTDDFAASIALSWNALKALRAGMFDPFVLHTSSTDMRMIRQCLEFLGARRANAVPQNTDRSLPRRPLDRLSYIDIDVSVGGAALGLETAGFKPLALHERWENAREILSWNRPAKEWPTSIRPYPDDAEAEFESYRAADLDLVTSGERFVPFERVSTTSSPSAESFARATYLIRQSRPKAFFFDFCATVMNQANSGFRERLEAEFSTFGFDIEWSVIALSDLGLPQNQSRAVLIGFRDGLMGRFDLPAFKMPSQSLCEVIRDLVLGGMAADIETVKERESFEQWADDWQKKCSDRVAPFFLEGAKIKRCPSEWASFDIEIGTYPAAQQTWREIQQRGNKFKLTPDMLKRLQGFPDDWRVHSMLNAQGHRIENSVSPPMAKLVGLALYTTLTGQQLDVAGAMSEPLALERFKTISLPGSRFGRKARKAYTTTVPQSWRPSHGKGLRGRYYQRPRTEDEAFRDHWKRYWADECTWDE